jgi:hypothetical protein
MMPTYDKLLRIKGKHLDTVETVAGELLSEMFPDTTRDNTSSANPTAGASPYGMLEYWEQKYLITPPTGATLAERRSVVIAYEAAIGGLSISYFEGIVEKLGYKIGTHAVVGDPHARLTDGDFPPFRADFSKADDKVWDQIPGTSYQTCCVRGTGVATDAILQDLINKLKKFGREVIYINE